MPPFCLGIGATSIGDFSSASGVLPVPTALAEACAHAVMKEGIDLAVSYCMQVDHGFAQPLEFLLGGLDTLPVLPVFINGVASPLPGFQRTRMLGEAVGRFLTTLNKRVLILGSGGLSHQLRCRSWRRPMPYARSAAGQRQTVAAGRAGTAPAAGHQRGETVYRRPELALSAQPRLGQPFYELLEQGRLMELDAVSNEELSAMAGKSTHEIKTWVAAFAALSAFGSWRCEGRYYRPIPEWIAGFGSLSATAQN